MRSAGFMFVFRFKKAATGTPDRFMQVPVRQTVILGRAEKVC